MTQKILVTGADGFIGSHLVDHLVRSGHSVRAFCLYNSFGHSGWLSDLNEDIKSEFEIVYGDVRDSNFVLEAAKGCSTIIHLASLITIPYSYSAPGSYVDTNINGTLNILNAAKLHGAHVIHTSTSEVYGTAQYVPIDEGHPLNAQSPYAATKIGADQLALSFHRSFEMPVSIVRPFNTFGPRQSARAVIPTIISQLMNKGELNLGEVESTRDFTYVSDTASGISSFIESADAVGKVINLGTGFEITIKDLASEIASLMGTSVEIKTEKNRLRPDKSEVMRLCSDNTLARKTLSWAPEFDDLKGLRKGLEKTIEWFLSNQKVLPVYTSSEYIY